MEPSEEQWTWLADSQLDLEIQNFHIKCAFIHKDKLIIFSRGQPPKVVEVCCSFLLIFDLVIEKGMVSAIDPNYKYIKLDPLTYAEFQVAPQIAQSGDDLLVRMPQEDNHAQGFPRQLLEFTIPKSKFDENLDLNTTFANQKIITVEFTEKKQ